MGQHYPPRLLRSAISGYAKQHIPQAALRKVLKAISADARARADKCWRTHKAPMAAYWKAVAVYANHASRALKVQP